MQTLPPIGGALLRSYKPSLISNKLLWSLRIHLRLYWTFADSLFLPPIVFPSPPTRNPCRRSQRKLALVYMLLRYRSADSHFGQSAYRVVPVPIYVCLLPPLMRYRRRTRQQYRHHNIFLSCFSTCSYISANLSLLLKPFLLHKRIFVTNALLFHHIAI